MNNNEITNELNEEDLDLGLEGAEDIDTDTDTEDTGGDDIEFEVDDEGNIIIPSEAEEEAPAEEEGEDSEGTEGDGNADKEQDETDTAEGDAPPAAEEEVVEPASVPDAKDTEIANLKKLLARKDAQIAERDSQIRDTLKSLGANENEGVAGLEKLAAEAADIPVEEYRRRKAERLQQEEALRIVQKQKFEEKTRRDLEEVHKAYPETKAYDSVFKLPNFAKFSKYRDLGLPPDEAYIAANPKGVMTSVAGAATQQARNLNNKGHLRSNVPKGSKDKSILLTKKELADMREMFPDLSDKELVALHKQTIKK